MSHLPRDYAVSSRIAVSAAMKLRRGLFAANVCRAKTVAKLSLRTVGFQGVLTAQVFAPTP
eukprot:6391391-Amphidinium_carterae.1